MFDVVAPFECVWTLPDTELIVMSEGSLFCYLLVYSRWHVLIVWNILRDN